MGGDMGFGGLVKGFLALLVIAPLGLWKLAELLGWVWSHLHWGSP
jgi:hypothetical protein